MISRKALIAAGVAAVLALAGCSAGAGSRSGSDGAAPKKFSTTASAKITFSWWGNQDRADQFDQALALFNKKYPNVKVVRNFNAWADYWTARNTEAAGHALPDVMMMDAGYISEYADKNLFTDLDPYRSGDLDLKGVDATVLKSGEVHDKLVGIPLGTNAWSMMYNKDVLDKLGVAYPSDHMTWDQLAAYVQKVDKAGAAATPRIYGAADYTGSMPNFIYWLMQKGNKVFTADGKPAFTEKDVETFVDSVKTVRDDKQFYPVSRTVALSPLDGFLANESALWFNFSTTAMQAMTDTGTQNIGMVTPPLSTGKKQHVLALKPSMLLSIPANSKQKAAAAALVDFLVTSPQVSKIFGTTLGTPATEKGRDAVTQNPADTVNLDYLDSVKSQLTASYPILPSGYGTIEAKWSDLHQQLEYGQITTKQFADSLFSEMSLSLGV
jgi:multiple sugar transport system substrate-binding protein